MLKKWNTSLFKAWAWIKLVLIVSIVILAFLMCLFKDHGYDPSPYRGYPNYWEYLR